MRPSKNPTDACKRRCQTSWRNFLVIATHFEHVTNCSQYGKCADHNQLLNSRDRHTLTIGSRTAPSRPRATTPRGAPEGLDPDWAYDVADESYPALADWEPRSCGRLGVRRHRARWRTLRPLTSNSWVQAKAPVSALRPAGGRPSEWPSVRTLTPLLGRLELLPDFRGGFRHSCVRDSCQFGQMPFSARAIYGMHCFCGSDQSDEAQKIRKLEEVRRAQWCTHSAAPLREWGSSIGRPLPLHQLGRGQRKQSARASAYSGSPAFFSPSMNFPARSARACSPDRSPVHDRSPLPPARCRPSDHCCSGWSPRTESQGRIPTRHRVNRGR